SSSARRISATSVARLVSPTKVEGHRDSWSSVFDSARERCSMSISSSSNAFGDRWTSLPSASSCRVSLLTENAANRYVTPRHFKTAGSWALRPFYATEGVRHHEFCNLPSQSCANLVGGAKVNTGIHAGINHLLHAFAERLPVPNEPDVLRACCLDDEPR